MKCSFGMAPSAFDADAEDGDDQQQMAANIMDHVPMLNIPPFGMCMSPGQSRPSLPPPPLRSAC